MSWHVYILKCSDGTLYTGATNDVGRRLAAHSAGKGAKYTRGRRPIKLLWKKRVKDRSAALKLEAKVKRMTRSDKRSMIDESSR